MPTPFEMGTGIQGYDAALAAERSASTNASPQLKQTPTMTLQDAQRQADQAFSGIVAPMTLEEIRAREEQAKAVTKETATSIYDPQISREKQVGGAQVSTAEGVVGQRQGFNISTAEQAFVAGVQDKVTDRIKEVESVKASYIAQGNLAAADRADNQLQQLNEFNTQMTIAKANYALQIMAGNREEARLGLEQARFGLEEKAQAFNQTMAEKNLAVSVANMLGYTEDGTATFAAKQAEINNAISEANITGDYNGQETLAAKTARLQYALSLRGIELDERQLEEVIRSNKVQEGLSAARLAGEKANETPSSLMNAAVERLNALKGTPQFNDLTYNAELADLAASQGYRGTTDPADKAILDNVNAQLQQALRLREQGITPTYDNSGNISQSSQDQQMLSIEDEYNNILMNNTRGRQPDMIDKNIAQEQLIKTGKYTQKEVKQAVGNWVDKTAAFFGLY